MLSNPSPFTGSYDELLKRLTRRMVQNELDNQIFDILRKAFEKELEQENPVLSRSDRVRLLRDVSKAILNDVQTKLDAAQ